MAQAKSSAKSQRPTPSPAAAGRSAAPAPEQAPEPVTTGDLKQVIEELKKRLASVEKQQDTTAAAPTTRKRKSRTGETSGAPATKPTVAPATPAIAPQPAVDHSIIEARLRDLCNLENALHLEEVAIHTRSKAATQEEFFLRQETQTLQLKLRSFRTATQHLREQEAELEKAVATLESQKQQLIEERQALAQLRQEIEATKEQLEADRAAMNERSIALAAPLAALVNDSEQRETMPRLSAQTLSFVRLACLVCLSVSAVIGLCVALAWLTISPTFRASATIAGLSADEAALHAEATDPAAWPSSVVLNRSMNMLEQRGMRLFQSASDMREALQSQMTIASSDGSIEFTYDSEHRDQAVLVLESLSRALVEIEAGSGASAGKPTILRAAAADLDPIRDGRMRGALGYLLLMIAIAAAIIASKRKLVRFSSNAT